MPVKFHNMPNPASDPEKTFDHLQAVARIALGVVPGTDVTVGLSRTVISSGALSINIPIGIAEWKAGADDKAGAVRKMLKALLGIGAYPEAGAPAAPTPAFAMVYDDMTDEQWVEHVAGQLFPGTTHLYQAKELYQPVLGTSGGSIYKTCFIGDDLKVAARIKSGSVSFRVTTGTDKCPTGQVLTVFQRLGVVSAYENRLTCHASMSGPYNIEHAHEYRALFGAFYAALKPWIKSGFPAIGKLAEGVK